jgi:hypothetical protein
LKPVSAHSLAMLQEGMARLIAGRPRVTDGRLTVVNLAREAGVGRSTANRAVDVLDTFRTSAARTARQRGPKADAAADRSRDLAQIATLRGTVNQLAQQVQRLALHCDQQRRTIDALRAALDEATAGKVVPFPGATS